MKIIIECFQTLDSTNSIVSSYNAHVRTTLDSFFFELFKSKRKEQQVRYIH